ncbi:MAG: hypothetical protein HY286_17750 [Planctomycetes bacterium]|nr:hypothetical protein [Planctomycetota bacterium]
MERILEILFGIAPRGEGGGFSRIEFARVPERGDARLLWILLIAAVFAAIYFLYRRDAARLSKRKRNILLALRLLSAAVLAFIVAEPAIVFERAETRPSQIVVLLDASASMDLPDAAADVKAPAKLAEILKYNSTGEFKQWTRAAAADRALQTFLAERLAEGGERQVHIYPFCDRLYSDAGGAAASGASARQTTAIGTAIEQALAAKGAAPLAGILLLTDGNSNAGPDPTRGAAVAAASRIPVASIALGSKGSRDAKIVEINVPEVVFSRDTININIVVDAGGGEDRNKTPGRIRLEARADKAGFEVVGEKEIGNNNDRSIRTIEFPWRPEKPGEYELRATLDDGDAENLGARKQQNAAVRVVRPELRTLLIAGHPFPEVQFLTQTLVRDPGISVSCWIQGADADFLQKGDIHIQRLPESEAEIDEYDTVVLYDPDPAAWPANFPALLTHLVGERGGGLVYISGESETLRIFERLVPGADALLDLLPVVREAGTFVSKVEQSLHARDPWKLDITEAGLEDGMFRFKDEELNNQQLLKNLPGMYWHFPVTRAKPGAVVLARHGDPRMTNAHGRQVVVASQLFGPGRVLFFACDSMYRWRFIDEQVYDGFWARVLDRAGKLKRLGGIHPIVVTVEPMHEGADSSVRVQARFRFTNDQSTPLAALAAVVDAPDGSSAPLSLRAAADGSRVFDGIYKPTGAGNYLVRVWASEEPKEKTGASMARFAIDADDREKVHTDVNRDVLEKIAKATGGKVYDLDHLSEAPSAFSLKSVTLVHQERREIWDAPVLIFLLFGALFLEWWLRKRNGLA